MPDKLDKVVAEAIKNKEQRAQGYREKALKMYPWICGRCEREFTRTNVQELTVHHRDHNHDNNPEDGSNWELLCVYCHDNEHQRQLEYDTHGHVDVDSTTGEATFNPFADLRSMMNKK
ncbi:YajD family HNH nuclease [Candidatus Venteria ishoeyi]|uniref:YajD family HNH nuclease n=1 Tax=Candidatus Venteria ishoeyi TaxID=1899563 RepID=UPI0025A67A92|nr:YajD family HNH nuclease [Candidatus Venteria ishoeyi]MDM8548282.1 YajD family HNH nuclease [Candidatus Venteria ishoeyi]